MGVMSREKLNSILMERAEDAAAADHSASLADARLRAVSGPAIVSQSPSMKSDTAPRADTAEPATARERAEAAPAKVEAAKPRSRRKPIFIGIGALALIAGVWFAYQYITVGRFIVSTDDAYVGVDMAIMSPKVPAYVAEVPIVDNQSVKEGDVLVRLDDGDYRLALDQAKSKLATQNAAIVTFDAQIKSATAAAARSMAPT